MQVPDIEGESAVEGLELKIDVYVKPLRVHKVNIVTTKKPKFANIGDYWNNEAVEKIINFLQEYQDLITSTFPEMKGISRQLG